MVVVVYTDRQRENLEIVCDWSVIVSPKGGEEEERRGSQSPLRCAVLRDALNWWWCSRERQRGKGLEGCGGCVYLFHEGKEEEEEISRASFCLLLLMPINKRTWRRRRRRRNGHVIQELIFDTASPFLQKLLLLALNDAAAFCLVPSRFKECEYTQHNT